MKPISPSEVAKAKRSVLPDFVIQAFNELIAAKYSNGRSVVLQNDAMFRIMSLAPHGTTRQTVYDNGWLNVEDVYRAEGWDVEYDKPGYCETYKARFIFEKTR